MSDEPPIDPEALLVALVLEPSTFSRNRFFHLYTHPAVRRARRRASLVRSVVRHMSAIPEEQRDDAVFYAPVDESFVALHYEVPSLGLRRKTTLDRTELALVRFSLASRAANEPDEEDRERIESALSRLAG
jgi:membrane peptidoglycan carboxypeptidase